MSRNQRRARARDGARRDADGAAPFSSAPATEPLSSAAAAIRRQTSASRKINTSILSCDTVAELLDLYDKCGEDFGAVNYATLLSKLARRAPKPACGELLLRMRALMRTMHERLERKSLADLDGRALATSAHGLVRLELGDPNARQLLRAIARAAEPVVSTFNAQDISVLAYSCARAGLANHERLFDALGRRGEELVDAFTAQGLANLTWSFASSGVDAPILFGLVARAAARLTHELSPQDCANLAWAFCRAGISAPSLFAAVEARGELTADAFNPQDMSNTAWAYASAGVPASGLFRALAHAAVRRRLRDFQSQHLAMMAFAYAKVGEPAPELFGAIAAQCAERMHELNAQELPNIAWAFASSGSHAPALWGALSAAAPSRIGHFSSQGLANLAWACAKAALHVPELFETIEREALRRMPSLALVELSSLVWALASAAVPAQRLYAAAAAAECDSGAPAAEPQAMLRKQEASGTAHAVASMLWAFGVGGHFMLADADQVWSLACALPVDEWSSTDALALEESLLTLSVDAPSKAGTAELVELREELWLRREPPPPSTPQRTRLCRALSDALCEHGWAHACDAAVDEAGLLVVDMVAGNLVVEVDSGPERLLTEPLTGATHANGATCWRTRMLEARGFAVLRFKPTLHALGGETLVCSHMSSSASSPAALGIVECAATMDARRRRPLAPLGQWQWPSTSPAIELGALPSGSSAYRHQPCASNRQQQLYDTLACNCSCATDDACYGEVPRQAHARRHQQAPNPRSRQLHFG